MAPMRPERITVGVLFAIAAGVAAQGAAAEQLNSRISGDEFTSQSRSIGPSVARRTFEWDARKGRWGLKLDMEQRTDRGMQLGDVQPGVFYRLTPRLHIGGAVSLGEDQVESVPGMQPQAPPPRVRLETTFKF